MIDKKRYLAIIGDAFDQLANLSLNDNKLIIQEKDFINALRITIKNNYYNEDTYKLGKKVNQTYKDILKDKQYNLFLIKRNNTNYLVYLANGNYKLTWNEKILTKLINYLTNVYKIKQLKEYLKNKDVHLIIKKKNKIIHQYIFPSNYLIDNQITLDLFFSKLIRKNKLESFMKNRKIKDKNQFVLNSYINFNNKSPLILDKKEIKLLNRYINLFTPVKYLFETDRMTKILNNAIQHKYIIQMNF